MGHKVWGGHFCPPPLTLLSRCSSMRRPCDKTVPGNQEMPDGQLPINRVNVKGGGQSVRPTRVSSGTITGEGCRSRCKMAHVRCPPSRRLRSESYRSAGGCPAGGVTRNSPRSAGVTLAGSPVRPVAARDGAHPGSAVWRKCPRGVAGAVFQAAWTRRGPH